MQFFSIFLYVSKDTIYLFSQLEEEKLKLSSFLLKRSMLFYNIVDPHWFLVVFTSMLIRIRIQEAEMNADPCRSMQIRILILIRLNRLALAEWVADLSRLVVGSSRAMMPQVAEKVSASASLMMREASTF
jgi:hypothetical protein